MLLHRLAGKRFPLILAILLAACTDAGPADPVHPPNYLLDGLGLHSDPEYSVVLSPTNAFLPPGDTIRFTATVLSGTDTIFNPDITWFVHDTIVAQVDSAGLVTSRWQGGFGVLVARYRDSRGAAAIVADTLGTRHYGLGTTQGVGGGVWPITGRSTFRYYIRFAEMENDWRPTATVKIQGEWPGASPQVFPVISPKGIPMPADLSRSTGPFWKDSVFYAVIAAPDDPSEDYSTWNATFDWNAHDDEEGFTTSHGARSLDLPPFHLTIVPVIWDSVPDYSIVDETRGLTANSLSIIEVLDMLPVQDNYPVTVREPFATKQDLTNDDGWRTLLSEIDSIRRTDTTRSYYYGAVAPFQESAVYGMAYVGYPVSAGYLAVIAHEIGHNMGLLHAPCGGAEGVDPDYPNENGLIDSWGLSVHWSLTWKDPAEFYDVMSYCNPRWISKYHFHKATFFRRLQEPLWWEAGAMMGPPEIIADPISLLDGYPSTGRRGR